jgi:phosphoribosylanthranilate isomerase
LRRRPRSRHQGCPCRPAFDPGEAEAYRGSVSALLYDTYVEGMDGGTGRTFPWETALPLPSGRRWWSPVACTPGNVPGAISALKPFAVDVSSGVEERPRHKDRSDCTRSWPRCERPMRR